MTGLSVVIVARNEAKKLEDCLRSVVWADDVIFVDNESTDETVKIAKKYKSKIYFTSDSNFSRRKNFAFSKTQNKWILSIDADEIVTSSLKKEILNIIQDDNKEIAAYAIPRKNIILGKELKHGWWPDYVVRLFRKDLFIRWESELHEQPKINGKLGYLKNPLIHNKHEKLEEMVEKTNKWSEIEAKLMYEAKHPPMNLVRFCTAIWREFYLRMIKQRAFLDGTVGVVYAIYQVYSRFLSYAKLWEMQQIKHQA